MGENLGRHGGALDPLGSASQPDYGANKTRPEIVGRGLPSSKPKLLREVRRDDPSNLEPKDQKKAEEVEAAKRYGARIESPGEIKLYSARNAYEVFAALREHVLPPMESGHKPRNLDMSYKPPAQLDVIDARARDLSKTVQDLIDRGWIINYNKETGTAEVTDEAFGGYAMYTTYTQRFNDELHVIENVPTYHFGKEDERKNLAEAYKAAGLELEARAIIGENYGVFLSLQARDNLEALVDWLHNTAAKFKPEHLKALFNAPDLDELARHPEKLNNKFGKDIEYSTFLYSVMLHSGTKKEMKEFLRRPGSTEIIRQIIRKSGKNISYDEWVKKNIGDVDNWIDNPVKDTDYEEDVKKGLRGPLTVFGNIVAFKSSSGKVFSREMERKYIEETVGGIVGSIEASWVAMSLLKAIDTFSSQGHTILSNGAVVATLGEGRGMEPTDTQKFYSLVWNLREGQKKRSFGLNDQLGKTPDMSFDLFDWAQVEVESENGEIIYRSIWDAWLGTAEQNKLDIRTMKPNVIGNIHSFTDEGGGWLKVKCIDPKTNKIELRKGKSEFGEDPKRYYENERRIYGDVIKDKNTQKIIGINERVHEEPYHELGELKFETLMSDFHGVCNTIKWLNGREGTGVLSDAMATTIDPGKIDQKLFLGQNKYIGIGLNPMVLAKGSMHRYSFGGNGDPQPVILDLNEFGMGQVVLPAVDGKAYEDIQRVFMNNIWLSRLKSDFFITKLATATMKVPDIEGRLASKEVEVPLHLQIVAIMKLLNGPAPKTIEELRNWRINLTQLALDSRNPNINRYRNSVAYFESQIRDSRGSLKPIGPVTGVTKMFK